MHGFKLYSYGNFHVGGQPEKTLTSVRISYSTEARFAATAELMPQMANLRRPD